MNIKNQRGQGTASSVNGDRVHRGGFVGFRAAAFVLLANASVAVAQVADPPEAGDPLEETWRYLLELFRMILGL